MLRQLGLYLTKDMKRPALGVLVVTALFLLGLPVLWLGYLLVALMTLHEGYKAGLIVLGMLLVSPIVIGVLGDPLVPIAVAIQGGVICLLASILQRNSLWSIVLLIEILLGLLGIMVFHLWAGDAPTWWRNELAAFWKQAGLATLMGVPKDQLPALVVKISHFMTGVFAASILLYSTIVLLLARAWQALLFNPGGLKKEFLVIRMPKIVSIVFLLCLVGVFFGVSPSQDMLVVLILPLMMVGISLMHFFADQKSELSIVLLLSFYAAFIFFIPYVMMTLVLVGFVDSWYNLRSIGQRSAEI